MNDALRMQISAFVDGELPENETELLLRRLSQDVALRRLVAEYLAIGRLIRRESEVAGMGAMRNRIAEALGEEPVEAGVRVETSGSRYLKPASGVAIAASVAALALVGLRQVDVTDPAAAPAAELQTLQTHNSGAPGYTEPLPSEVLSDQPSEMLMQYYLRHGETSADLGANGILTRLVTMELREGELVEIEPGSGMIDATLERAAGAPPDNTQKNDPENRTGEQ